MGTSKYIVSLLDMWGDEQEGYVENTRYALGTIEIQKGFEDVSADDLLGALMDFQCRDTIGRMCSPASGLRKKDLKCEEPYKDGLWFEVSLKAGGPPIFGLQHTNEVKER